MFIDGQIKNLCVTMPPQHGKSEIVSRKAPAYALGIDPDLNIACCTYSADLARKFNRNVQMIIDDEEYKELFPDTALMTSNIRSSTKGSYVRNTDEFDIVGYRGNYKAVGVGGPLTGNKVDIGIIDDPVKDRADANSKTMRNRIWDWYTDVYKTRLHNNSQTLLCGTRWHEDDLIGRILKSEDDWTIVNFTAIKDVEDPNDPREMGEALWPSRHSKEKLEKEMKNERTWASLYQQRPAPIKGNIIKKEWFPVVKNLFPVPSDFYLDAAYTEDSKNDPSCLMEYKHHNGKVQIVKSYLFWMEAPDLVDEIRKIMVNPYSRLKIEPKASGKSIYQYLKKRVKGKRKILVDEDQAPTESKPSRAHGVTPYMAQNDVQVLEGDWNANFFDECKVFPNGAHDDQVDCLTAICRICFIEKNFSASDMSGHSHGSI